MKLIKTGMKMTEKINQASIAQLDLDKQIQLLGIMETMKDLNKSNDKNAVDDYNVLIFGHLYFIGAKVGWWDINTIAEWATTEMKLKSPEVTQDFFIRLINTIQQTITKTHDAGIQA